MNEPVSEVIDLSEVKEQRPARLPVVTGTTPADLLRLAVQGGADLDRLERLMTMQIQWEKHEAEKAYNEALAGFKSEAIEIIKRKTVDFTSPKGRTRYKHAELSDVIEAIGPALSKHGFSWGWSLSQKPDWIEVTCTLKHKQGFSESATLGGPPDDSGNKNKIQMISSTITYLERQTLKAIAGVAEKGDDTDGRPPAGAPEDDKPSPELNKLLDVGNAKADKGLKVLTEWWGSLTEPQRKQVQPYFTAMRNAARKAGA